MSQSTSKPNYELLKDAYAILAGIPAKAYALSTIREHKGESLSCGTIACGFGWLGMHPQFQALGLKTMGRMDLRVNNASMGVGGAGLAIFGLPLNDGMELFGTRRSCRPQDTGKPDKIILLNRIMAYLDQKGQVTNPVYL